MELNINNKFDYYLSNLDSSGNSVTQSIIPVTDSSGNLVTGQSFNKSFD